jgi:hypothetical protein
MGWSTIKRDTFAAGASMHCDCGMRFQYLDVDRSEVGDTDVNLGKDVNPG